jgi:hypothetical protein
MKKENWANTPNVEEQEMKMFPADESTANQACCGRSYNEESDFSPTNYFAALQNILDKRNELLSSVKANKQP